MRQLPVIEPIEWNCLVKDVRKIFCVVIGTWSLEVAIALERCPRTSRALCRMPSDFCAWEPMWHVRGRCGNNVI